MRLCPASPGRGTLRFRRGSCAGVGSQRIRAPVSGGSTRTSSRWHSLARSASLQGRLRPLSTARRRVSCRRSCVPWRKATAASRAPARCPTAASRPRRTRPAGWPRSEGNGNCLSEPPAPNPPVEAPAKRAGRARKREKQVIGKAPFGGRSGRSENPGSPFPEDAERSRDGRRGTCAGQGTGPEGWPSPLLG